MIGAVVTGAFLFVLCLAIPFLAWSSYRYSSRSRDKEEAVPSSNAVAIQSLVMHGIVFGLALATASSTGLGVVWFSRPSLEVLAIGLVIVLLFAAIAVLDARRPLGAHERLRAQLRRSGLSRVWLATMMAAAVAEEYAYRGVLYGVLDAHFSWPAAAAVAAAAFGLGHFSQGIRGVALSMAFAGSMQLLLAISGSLIVPMVCHLLYDLAVSLYGRFFTAEGRAD